MIFDFRESPSSGFRVWEVGVDGTGLRHLTFPPPDEAEKVARWGKPWHTDDIHPAYLPDGGIIFSSTRCEHTILCGGSAHLVAPVLHRMASDGASIEQLTKSPVSEFSPVVLDDGRVLYHRWEYVGKGARVAKTIWSMNPDGSHAIELYGLPTMTGRVPTFCFNVPGHRPSEVAVFLAERDIAVWHGDYYAVETMRHLGLDDGAVRAGIVHYNTAEEVDRLLAGLAELA